MANVFPTEPTRTPTTIGSIRYEFEDTNGTANGLNSQITVYVLDADNQPMRVVNLRNVAKHLTATEKTQMLAIFARLRALAATELLS